MIAASFSAPLENPTQKNGGGVCVECSVQVPLLLERIDARRPVVEMVAEERLQLPILGAREEIHCRTSSEVL